MKNMFHRSAPWVLGIGSGLIAGLVSLVILNIASKLITIL